MADAAHDARPTTIGEYREWLRDKHDVKVDRAAAVYHEAVTQKVARTFGESTFWDTLCQQLKEFDAEYQMKTSSYTLLMTPNQTPSLDEKKFDSFILKTFRKNVLSNANWPDPPPGGWFLPGNWYERINDPVRTTLVVKYLDGVAFLAERVLALAAELGMETSYDLEAKPEGYYAGHVYVRIDATVPTVTWETRKLRPLVEIQVTTQLQDVIRRLLHNYYRDRRSLPQPQQTKWQWDYKSDEFVTNYLGHILHYVEGMIMEIREKQISDVLTRESAP